MSVTILLDSGHGGMVAGHYQTPGKRSPVWDDGTVLYEGEFNRGVKSRLKEMLQERGIKYVDINPQDTDLNLSERVEVANNYDNSLFISIHANAGGGKGCEVFTSENCSSESTRMAKCIEAQYSPHFYGERWRGIKKRDFYVIKNTKMPAILVEAFFMDTERECRKYLMTRHGREQIAKWIFSSILDYIK